MTRRFWRLDTPIGTSVNWKLQRRYPYGSGHIALVNVHNRIRLLSGEQYGLRVSSIKGYGTQVEINLPARQASDR